MVGVLRGVSVGAVVSTALTIRSPLDRLKVAATASNEPISAIPRRLSRRVHLLRAAPRDAGVVVARGRETSDIVGHVKRQCGRPTENGAIDAGNSTGDGFKVGRRLAHVARAWTTRIAHLVSSKSTKTSQSASAKWPRTPRSRMWCETTRTATKSATSTPIVLATSATPLRGLSR